jgi:hypothetical protein
MNAPTDLWPLEAMDHDIGRERIQDGQGAEGRLLSASAWRGSCRGGVVVLTAASPEQAVFYDHQLGVHDASAASCMLFLPSTPPILASHAHSVASVVWQFISQAKPYSHQVSLITDIPMLRYQFLLSFDLNDT